MASETPETKGKVAIHVFDEYRKQAKDFSCSRDLLLSKMKYFQAYLNEANIHDEIDISVDCDVEVFAWLVEYMHQSNDEWQSKISLDNVAPILVSSEFLQMEELVNGCIAFIVSNLQQFVQLRVDLSCLSDIAVSKLADQCSPVAVRKMYDRKDKIKTKLQRKQVDAMLKVLDGNLQFCTKCEQLFLMTTVEDTHCYQGVRRINVRGDLVARHEAKPHWSSSAFVKEVMESKSLSWGVVYWYIWAATRCSQCKECGKTYSLLELHGCAYHYGSIEGRGREAKYTCCGARGFSSDESEVRGCTLQDHVPDRLEQGDVKEIWTYIHESGLMDEVKEQSGASVQIDFFSDKRKHDGPRSRLHKESLGVDSEQGKSKSANRRASSAALPGSPRREKQFKALKLQERDAVRTKELMQRLIQLRVDT